MDILGRFLQFDVWVMQRLFESCREIMPEQLQTKFDIGHETLQATLLHLVATMEFWTDLLYARQWRGEGPEPEVTVLIEHLRTRFAAVSAEFGNIARTLAAENRLDEIMVDSFYNPPADMTKGTVIADIILHNQLHRSEAVHMLKRLGITADGDLVGWEWEMEKREHRLGLKGMQ